MGAPGFSSRWGRRGFLQDGGAGFFFKMGAPGFSSRWGAEFFFKMGRRVSLQDGGAEFFSFHGATGGAKSGGAVIFIRTVIMIYDFNTNTCISNKLDFLIRCG